MVNASFLKRNEIAVRFLKTSKHSENRRKLPASKRPKMVNASFLKRSEIAVRFLKTSKRSENRRKSIQKW